MLDIGTVIAGKYKVVRKLGAGAMGAVYHVEHTTIARAFAIKVLHARFVENSDAVARFEQEARAAGSIGHENVVDVFDFGEHAGQPYIVMEMLRGETVADKLSRVPAFVPREACRIAGHMLSALATVHAKGVIHRDLKPENVFLMARKGAPDVVKLLDFGISKIHTPTSDGRSITRQGALLGTPQYMAPEQWDERTEVDHRADLWACGVTLYEMLTGGLPYEGANEAEFFKEVVRGSSVPRAPSEVAREAAIPHPLDAAVLRAVQRSRDDRFASAREFLEAIRPFGAEQIPVTDEPPSRRPTRAIPLARARVSIDAQPTTEPSETATSNRIDAPPGIAQTEPTTEDAPAVHVKPRRAGHGVAVLMALVVVVGGVAVRTVVARSSSVPAAPRAIVATTVRTASPPPEAHVIAAALPTEAPIAGPTPVGASAVVAADARIASPVQHRTARAGAHGATHGTSANDEDDENAIVIPTHATWIPTSPTSTDRAAP